MSLWTVPRSIRCFALFSVVALLVAPNTLAFEHKVCTKVTIDEPFVLPNDSEHPPGAIKLCRIEGHTPSGSMHVTYVDGHPISMVVGHRGHNESGDEPEPFMIFARDSTGRLHLQGYAVPGRDGMETFTLERPGRGKA